MKCCCCAYQSVLLVTGSIPNGSVLSHPGGSRVQFSIHSPPAIWGQQERVSREAQGDDDSGCSVADRLGPGGQSPQSGFFLRVGFFLLPPLQVPLPHACSLSHISNPSSLFLARFCQFLQKSKLCKFFCFQLLPDEFLFLFESLFLVECELWDKGDL